VGTTGRSPTGLRGDLGESDMFQGFRLRLDRPRSSPALIDFREPKKRLRKVNINEGKKILMAAILVFPNNRKILQKKRTLPEGEKFH